LLAQGAAERFSGPPTLKTPTAEYAFSRFPSFNSTPFAIPAPPALPAINAAGSSELLTLPPPIGFTQYTISNPASASNPRTPFHTSPADPPLPADINGVPIQTVVNDPITLLQQVIKQQVDQGFTFEGTVLNISTQPQLLFLPNANSSVGPPVVVKPPNGAGGIENILFLEGGDPVGPKGPNADTVTVYATFWIEKVTRKGHPHFMQLQYAQMVVLNFPIFSKLPTVVPLGWPHISVATLTKSFN